MRACEKRFTSLTAINGKITYCERIWGERQVLKKRVIYCGSRSKCTKIFRSKKDFVKICGQIATITVLHRFSRLGLKPEVDPLASHICSNLIAPLFSEFLFIIIWLKLIAPFFISKFCRLALVWYFWSWQTY